MKQVEIQPFLIDFFESRQASIVEKSDGILTIKLTEQLDEQLMNRPFYWQYVKKLGKVGETMSVTFITAEEKENRLKESGFTSVLLDWIRSSKSSNKRVRIPSFTRIASLTKQ